MASSKSKSKRPVQQGASAPAGTAVSAVSSAADKAKQAKPAKAAAKDGKGGKKGSKKNQKPSLFNRIGSYFKGVRTEVKRVVWPSKPELVKYTAAVLVMLVFFGVLIALVDAVIVPALYAFSGLR